jgi:hypothetical protein
MSSVFVAVLLSKGKVGTCAFLEDVGVEEV